MHHAWLLAGPAGVGKGSFARAAAARILADAAGPRSDLPGLELPDDNPTAKLIAAGSHPDLRLLEAMETVESVMPVQQPFKLASREVRRDSTEVRINGVTVGGRDVVVMAGPCSVESQAQVLEVADAVKGSGAKVLRGGAYKPRTSPYAFQGLKEEGLRYLAEARKRTGLPVVTEVLETESVEVVAEYSDILQIGARNAQNFVQ